MNKDDANQSIYKACEVNNIALLVQNLPQSFGDESIVSAALIATKKGNLESLKIIGKYLSNYQWEMYKNQTGFFEKIPQENKCIAWKEEESIVRAENKKTFEEKNFLGKTIAIMTENKDEVLFSHPDYKMGNHSNLLCKEHMVSLNKKLNPHHIFIHESFNGEGPIYYKIKVQSNQVSNNKIIKAIFPLVQKEVFSSKHISETIDFLNQNYSKELYDKIDKLDTKFDESKVLSVRQSFQGLVDTNKLTP